MNPERARVDPVWLELLNHPDLRPMSRIDDPNGPWRHLTPEEVLALVREGERPDR